MIWPGPDPEMERRREKFLGWATMISLVGMMIFVVVAAGHAR